MKRISRKKLISEIEELRQGFASAKSVAISHEDPVAYRSFDSCHLQADRLVVALGGESVRFGEDNGKARI